MMELFELVKVDNDGTISNKVEIAKTLNSFFLNLQNNLNPRSELKNDLHCQCNGCHAFATGHCNMTLLFVHQGHDL